MLCAARVIVSNFVHSRAFSLDLFRQLLFRFVSRHVPKYQN